MWLSVRRHPELPEEKPEISAPIENEVEEMREYGLRYAVLINPRVRFVTARRSATARI